MVNKQPSSSSKSTSMMKMAAWDVDDDVGDLDGDRDSNDHDDNDDDGGGGGDDDVEEKEKEYDRIVKNKGETDAVATVDDDESLLDRGDNYDLRDRRKMMLNAEIRGHGHSTGSDNNRRGSRSSKHLQVSGLLFCSLYALDSI